MRDISPIGLVALFSGFRRSGIFGVSLRTAPDMNKTGNPYHGKVSKLTDVTCVIGADYTSAMNKERDRLGIVERFEPKPRSWGTHIGDTPLIEHNGTLYLEMICLRSRQPAYVFADGAPCDDGIRAWLKKADPREIVVGDDVPDDQLGEEQVRSYLSKVIYRTPKIESIERIRFAGEEFRIVHSPASVAVAV